jgi:hypothetical protein
MKVSILTHPFPIDLPFWVLWSTVFGPLLLGSRALHPRRRCGHRAPGTASTLNWFEPRWRSRGCPLSWWPAQIGCRGVAQSWPTVKKR